MRSIQRVLPLSGMLALLPLQAQVSTLSLSVDNQFQFDPAVKVGSAFGTGTSAFQVSQITAKLSNSNPSASSSVAGSIYVADLNKLPVGSPVGSLTMTTTVGAFGVADATFTPDAPLILGANQNYLFVLSSLFGNWSWIETSSTNGFSTSGSNPWTMPIGISVNQGVVPTWSRSDNTTVPAYDYRNQVSIQGAAVPEPGWTAVAVGAGLAAWSLVRRRRWI